MNMDVAIPGFEPMSVGQLLANGDLGVGAMTSFVGTINGVPYEPGYLGKRKTYWYESAMTRTVELEFYNETINVVKSSAPGTAPTPVSRKQRKVFNLPCVRIAEQFPVLAEEVDGIRKLAGVGLDDIPTEADRKLRIAIRNIRSTWEWQRVNAAMGIVLDEDGTVIQNYFTDLGVTQPTVNVLFGTPSTGKWETICMNLKNQLEDALGNLDGDDEFEPLILCGRTFFERFITQPDVILAYTYFQERNQTENPMRDDVRYVDFKFGGFRWRQYRGGANNTGRFLPDNEAIVIVDNVPGTYLGFWCPPKDNKVFVNKPGLPIVAAVQELPLDEGYNFRLQSNCIHIMTRPAASILLESTN